MGEKINIVGAYLHKYMQLKKLSQIKSQLEGNYHVASRLDGEEDSFSLCRVLWI